MLNRLREKFQRFMIGRYGMDQLGQFMVSAVLVVIVVNLFVRAALPSMILNCWSWQAFLPCISVCFQRMWDSGTRRTRHI